ncbi:MAG: cation:proton antiporter [Elusimicrobiota bacterium]|jgi:CPA2 family monovalent cation:H+ antiporter-2
MSSIRFLQDLTVVLFIAAAVILLFRRLKQPPIIGYLIAGLIIGPYTPPTLLITDIHAIEALAEIGVVFLLFALGIEFNLGRLAKAGIKSVLCAGLEYGLMTAVGWGVGAWLGWSPLERLILGGVIGVTGTAIVSKTLLERVNRPAGWEELVAGMLIAEDIISVFLIAAFSSAAGFNDFSLSAVLSMLARFGMLLVVLMAVGLIVLPRILKAAGQSGMEEVRSIVIVGICFGTALLTQKLGYSAALGAFLAGAMASMGGPTPKLHETASPFKDVFGAVFFVSVGMLIDPRWLISHWQLSSILVVVVVLTRAAVNFLALASVGEKPASSLQAALAMLPIGEFSFILAQLAQQQGLTSKPVYPISVMLCLGTSLVSAQLLPVATDSRIDRFFPGRLARLLRVYQEGLARFTMPSRAAQVWMILRPSLVQVVVNLAGISALFLAARAVQERYFPLESPGIIWMAVALLTLPFLIALVRKTQAVTLILMEAASHAAGREHPPLETHPILVRMAIGLSTAVIAVWYLRISVILLPPWPHAIMPLLVVGLTGILLWRRMIRLYSLLQSALRESLSHGQAEFESAARALSVFTDALSPEKVHVEPFCLRLGHWAGGKTLQEIGLRAKTGTSILQINRRGIPIPSPGPESRIQPEDELLLIGETNQLRMAKLLLESGGVDTASDSASDS